MTPNTDSGRRCGFIILSLTITVILIIVIAGVCVRFLIEGTIQRIILIVLICVLFVVGMVGLVTLALHSRRVKKQRNYNSNIQNVGMNQKVKYRTAPTAPPMTTESNWNYAKNYSNRTTAQA